MTNSSPRGTDGSWTVDAATADLRRRIVDGEFRAEDGGPGKLPAAGDLGKRYGLSRNAMNRGIEKLRIEGLISTRQGAPAVVLERKPHVYRPQLETAGLSGTALKQLSERIASQIHDQGRLRLDQTDVLPADEMVRSRLGLKAGELVAVRKGTILVNGVAVHTRDCFAPQQLVDGSGWLVQESEDGANQVLANLGYVLDQRTDELTPRLTTSEESERLGLGDGNSVPTIELLSTSYDRDGRPVQVVLLSLPRHRNTVVYTHGGTPTP
ncbi:GntR family transcriptional regulator [Streptomyces sp. NPDC059835]|uniref:GntR family transcriptional regulator n=1 Tax=Streptomyces sp. NPDC059835 TaxID=3346967 RepID=UPI00366550CD